jgi:Ca-activated chloride channel homolog
MQKAKRTFRNLSSNFDKKPAPAGKTCGNIRPIEVVLMARLSRGDGRWSPRLEARVRCVRVDSFSNPLLSKLCQIKLRLKLRLKLRPYLHWGNLRPWNALALVFCVVVGLGAFSLAQTDVNDVHVTPREVEKPKEAPASDTLATATPGMTAHVRPLKVDVDLVLVPVTITDPLNRLVTGLEKENFQLFEGNAAQEIRTFSSEDAPVSLGVIFDSSGSMSSKMDRAKDAVMEFFKTANPQDEFFMITFSDEPEEVSDFTSSVDEIQNKLVFAVPRRRTALLDAIYMGVSKMRQAKYAKKALLIISDGGDNHSRYTENEIRSLVKEADVMIYAIGIYDRYASAVEERLGPQLLSDITELSGGRAFTIDNPNDLGDVATKIGVELRNQYVLGYRPAKVVRDGKWRKIKVKLLPPKGLPPLRVYARTGYYAPAE